MHFSAILHGAFLLAAGALAYPSPAPALIKRNVRALPFDDNTCSRQEQDAITKAFNQGLMMIENAIDTGSVHSLPFKTFFDQSQNGWGAFQIGLDPKDPDGIWPVVRGVFKNMKNLITTTNVDFKISCGKVESCKDGTQAFTVKNPKMNIHFCPNFFVSRWMLRLSEFRSIPAFEDLKCKKDKNGVQSLDLGAASLKSPAQVDVLKWLPATTVVHELSHLLPAQARGPVKHITDCFYGAFAGEFMAIHDPRAAVANADNYAWFAITQYLNTLCGADNADKVYYRAWEDKSVLFVPEMETFKGQLKDFPNRTASKGALSLKLRRQIDELKASVEEWEKENPNPSAASKVKIESIKQKIVSGEDSLERNAYDEKICNQQVKWDYVEKTMAKRPHS